MSLPWDDPDADPIADMRSLRDRPMSPPGQPVLVPQRLKDMLAGHISDDALVAYPTEPPTDGCVFCRDVSFDPYDGARGPGLPHEALAVLCRCDRTAGSLP